jgi:hypothetical protein
MVKVVDEIAAEASIEEGMYLCSSPTPTANKG